MKKSSVAGNAMWLILSRAAQSLLALAVTMLTARYLGPSNFGLINYASSMVGFASPIAMLGLNSVLVHEIIMDEQHEGTILGSAIGISLLTGILSMAGIVSVSLLISPDDKAGAAVCFLYSFILVFQSLDLIECWFQAKLIAKYSAAAMLAAYIIVSAYKIVLLAAKSSIYWFALSNALDLAIIAFVLLILYKRLGGQEIRFSWHQVRRLVLKSRYYIITNLMITVCSQTDKVMLKVMLGEHAAGLYSAAVSCALMTNFVFSAMINSGRPAIFEARKKNYAVYETDMKILFSCIIFLSLMECVLMSVFSEVLLGVIYGKKFLSASSVLKVFVWQNVFSYIGSVRGIWLLVEGKLKYVTILGVFSAIGNVMLNSICIPAMGMMGAAAASLLTQIFANMIMPLCIKDLKQSNLILLQSLHIKYAAGMLRTMIKKD